MTSFRFEDREFTKQFLEELGFTKYVPRLEEKMDSIPTTKKEYYIELNEHQEVVFCSICARYMYTRVEHIFYDKDRPNDFKSTQEGEENYIEYLEYRGL